MTKLQENQSYICKNSLALSFTNCSEVQDFVHTTQTLFQLIPRCLYFTLGQNPTLIAPKTLANCLLRTLLNIVLPAKTVSALPLSVVEKDKLLF